MNLIKAIFELLSPTPKCQICGKRMAMSTDSSINTCECEEI